MGVSAIRTITGMVRRASLQRDSSMPRSTRTLETLRLLLRPPTTADLPHIQRYAVQEPFYRYMEMDAPTPESVETYLATVIAAWEEPHGRERVFAIEPRQAGRIAGLIRITIDADASELGAPSGTVSTRTVRAAGTQPKRCRRWCASGSRSSAFAGSGQRSIPGTRDPGRCSRERAFAERNGCPGTGPSQADSYLYAVLNDDVFIR